MIDFADLKVTEEEADLIDRIADRAYEWSQGIPDIPPVTKLNLAMDLTACHAHPNGCRLDLTGLLEADQGDFNHDVFGIHRFLDRETGELTHQFVPRLHEERPA